MANSEESRRGVFVVVEGPDRSGKSTLISKFANGLSEKSFEVITFPDRGTPSGKIIDRFLQTGNLDQNLSKMESVMKLHELFAENRREKKGLIKKILNSGKNLISDRYAYSGVAYSLAQGLDMKYCFNSDKGNIAPDAVIHLNISVEELSKRGGFGHEIYEKKEMQERIIRSYNQVYTQLISTKELSKTPQHKKLNDLNFYTFHDKCPYLFIIDANENHNPIYENVKEIVETLINVRSNPTVPSPRDLFENDTLTNFTH